MSILEKLQKAIFGADVTTVESILKLQNDILNQTDDATGSSPLHYAAYSGNVAITRLLIEHGAVIEAVTKKQETPLHMACARRNAHVVNILIESGADNYPVTESGWSPLHSCSLYNSVECADKLRLHSGQINEQDIYGITPLHIASYYGHHQIVKWLLNHQADPEITDRLGRLPIHLTCATGSTIVLDELLRRDISLNKSDDRERTIFHYACLSEARQANTIELIRFLEERSNVTVWTPDADQCYPIMIALAGNRMKVAKFLLTCSRGRNHHNLFKTFLFSASVDPSSYFFNYLRKQIHQEIMFMTDEHGFSALHYAAEYDRADRVACLISLGFDVNSKALCDVRPLHCAVLRGNHDAVVTLLGSGADDSATTDDGVTALHLAASQPYPDICSMLMDSEVDAAARDKHGRTALMNLCNVYFETDEAIRLLTRFLSITPSNFDVKKLVQMKDKYGWTALHFACARGNPAMAMELIKAGADVCAQDNQKRNPCHLGMQSTEANKILSILSLKSKSVSLQRDNHGFLSVHYASMRNNPAIVVELLNYTSTKSRRMPQSGLPHQLTPLHLAAIHGNVKTVTAILNFFKTTGQENGQESDVNSSFESVGARNYDPLLAEDNLRRIPLHYAMKYGYDKLLEVLLPPKRSVILLNCQDTYGLTPLMLAAANGKEKCVKIALRDLDDHPEAGNVLKRTDTQRRCAAMLAVTAPGTCYRFLLNSENLTKKDRNRRGLLHRAAFNQKNDLLAEILKIAPDEVNSQDVFGVTPLHYACASGNIEGLVRFLAANANLKALDLKNKSPADWAIEAGQHRVLEYILKNHEDSVIFEDFSVCKAATNGHIRCIELLTRYDSDIVQYHIDDKSALHFACERGQSSVVKFLIQNGAYLDVIEKDGRTPLMLAAMCKAGAKCVEYLIKDPTCPLTCIDVNGNMALHLACLYDNGDSARTIYNALEAKGQLSSALSVKNKKNETLLHLAVKMSSKEMIQLLSKQMADALFDQDYKGRIPLTCMIQEPVICENMRILLMACVKLGQSASLNTTYDVNSSYNNSLDTDGSEEPCESY